MIFITDTSSLDLWLTPLISLIMTTIVSGIVGTIVKNLMEKKFKEKEEKDKKTRKEYDELVELRNTKRDEELNDLIIGTINTSIAPIKEKINMIEDITNKNKEGTITLLRNEMKMLMDDYKSRGYASNTDKANWNQLYNTYKKLGGNHFKEYVDQWKHTVDELPKNIE